MTSVNRNPRYYTWFFSLDVSIKAGSRYADASSISPNNFLDVLHSENCQQIQRVRLHAAEDTSIISFSINTDAASVFCVENDEGFKIPVTQITGFISTDRQMYKTVVQDWLLHPCIFNLELTAIPNRHSHEKIKAFLAESRLDDVDHRGFRLRVDLYKASAAPKLCKGGRPKKLDPAASIGHWQPPPPSTESTAAPTPPPPEAPPRASLRTRIQYGASGPNPWRNSVAADSAAALQESLGPCAVVVAAAGLPPPLYVSAVPSALSSAFASSFSRRTAAAAEAAAEEAPAAPDAAETGWTTAAGTGEPRSSRLPPLPPAGAPRPAAEPVEAGREAPISSHGAPLTGKRNRDEPRGDGSAGTPAASCGGGGGAAAFCSGGGGGGGGGGATIYPSLARAGVVTAEAVAKAATSRETAGREAAAAVTAAERAVLAAQREEAAERVAAAWEEEVAQAARVRAATAAAAAGREEEASQAAQALAAVQVARAAVAAARTAAARTAAARAAATPASRCP